MTIKLQQAAIILSDGVIRVWCFSRAYCLPIALQLQLVSKVLPQTRSSFSGHSPWFDRDPRYPHKAGGRKFDFGHIKSFIARSLKVENPLSQNVGSIINHLHYSTGVAQWGTPSCGRPQPATDNGARDGRSNWLVSPPTLMGCTPCAPRAQYKSVQSQPQLGSTLKLQHARQPPCLCSHSGYNFDSVLRLELSCQSSMMSQFDQIFNSQQ